MLSPLSHTGLTGNDLLSSGPQGPRPAWGEGAGTSSVPGERVRGSTASLKEQMNRSERRARRSPGTQRERTCFFLRSRRHISAVSAVKAVAVHLCHHASITTISGSDIFHLRNQRHQRNQRFRQKGGVFFRGVK